ncbi:MAG: hypothetical protein KME29_03830 [Calothrix sp. FI2-JRJ7]|jgi:hypothetical protein|nr:hypothetical protein [Calothrix sp. FI2-JRJ7]MBW4598750.1 hypothetical protein [Calothrix sp. FI2-JRJ7]
MAEPTLTQVFGTNATQDATTITIYKADLTGLTATANNSAESILAAIDLKASSYLTQTNQDLNPDQSIVIEQGTGSITTRNNLNYREYNLTITLSKLDTQSAIDPNDF